MLNKNHLDPLCDSEGEAVYVRWERYKNRRSRGFFTLTATVLLWFGSA